MDLNYFSFAAEVRLTMGNNYRDFVRKVRQIMYMRMAHTCSMGHTFRSTAVV